MTLNLISSKSSERRLKAKRKLKKNFPFYSRKALKIRTEDGGVEPFILNDPQVFAHEALEKQLKETGKIRALILKGRQQGMSTYVEGRFFWKTTFRRGVKAFILCHMDKASANVFTMVKRFYEHCMPMLRPSKSYSNAKELVFDKLESGYTIGTAKSQGVGRSDTIQYFHGSEVAYWANATDHLAGVMQTIPDMTGTEIILESTSNGSQDVFYDMCMKAQKGIGEFILVFIPWSMSVKYRKQLPKDFELTPDELTYKATYQLDDEQIMWRRNKILELNGIWHFRREYPSNIDEAFTTEHPGALWTRDLLDKMLIKDGFKPVFKRIIVSVDPAVTAHEKSDETGIIVLGLGEDDKAYLIDDRSGKYKPAEWAKIAVELYHDHDADRIIAEVNQGGDMVESTIRVEDKNVAYKAVRASKGKWVRAEPVAALCEKHKVKHMIYSSVLEDQLTSYIPFVADSPDRLDAYVHGLTELMIKPQFEGYDEIEEYKEDENPIHSDETDW